MKNKLILTTILLMLCCMVVQATQDIDTVWMRQEQGDVLSISFHPSSQFFVTGNPNWFAGIWDVNTGTETKKYTGYPGGNVFFSKTGKYLVQASNSGFQVHNFTNDSLVLKKDGFPDFSTLHIAISADEKYIAAGDGLILTIWDLQTGEKIKEINPVVKNDTRPQPQLHQIEFSVDGSHIAFSMGHGDNNGEGIRFINLLNDSIDYAYPIGYYCNFKYSNDGTKIAFTSADSGESIKIMDLKTKQIVAIIPGIHQSVSQICFSSDDNFLVIPNFNTMNNLELWDLKQNKLIENFYTIPAGYLFGACSISNDKKYIVASSGAYLFLFNISLINDVQNIKTPSTTILYPNPINQNIINLSFDLAISNLTLINIYDINGQIVKQIENKYLPFGTYKYTVDLSTLINGSYYLKISSGTYNYSQALIINR